MCPPAAAARGGETKEGAGNKGQGIYAGGGGWWAAARTIGDILKGKRRGEWEKGMKYG